MPPTLAPFSRCSSSRSRYLPPNRHSEAETCPRRSRVKEARAVFQGAAPTPCKFDDVPVNTLLLDIWIVGERHAISAPAAS
jgi:hypothetical protein